MCSMCRLPLYMDDIARVPLAKPNNMSTDVKGKCKVKATPGVDCTKYGSKLAAFVDYMNQEVASNPESKFILFIQFKQLTHLVSKALTEFRMWYAMEMFFNVRMLYRSSKNRSRCV